MRLIFLLFILAFQLSISYAQNYKIGQSLETLEGDADDPARFMDFYRFKGESNYLINIGAKINITQVPVAPAISPAFIQKVLGEYHKNNLADSLQDNLHLGYGITYNLPGPLFPGNNWFATANAKYAWDRIDTSHNIVADLLFFFRNDNGALNWNANIMINNSTLLIATFGGVQVQHAFVSEKKYQEGFIMRPIFTINTNYTIGQQPAAVPINPLVRIYANYTARYASINNTESPEFFSDLFRAGVEYFLINNPINVTVGISYNYGSDPVRGLKNQNFILFSLNISR